MKKNGVLGGFFVLAILLAAAGYSTLVAMNAGPTVAVEPVAEVAAADDGDCAAGLEPAEDGSSVSVAATDAACARCPDGSPMCYSDKSCDKFCGGKGFGACVQINSCYKCCYCAL